jgi:ubiquinone/menaquinone biosynthesis C-methylase UbiE
MAWDPSWDSVFQNNAWGKYPSESLIRFIAKNYYSRSRKDVKILEIGCGPGANVWYMSREGFSAYGIDGSATAIGQARKRMAGDNLSADLRVGDATRLPYEDGTFDAAIDVECLYSNPEEGAKKMLAEASRVLKKDGMLFSQTFAEDMYAGSSNKKTGDLEYSAISDGPLAKQGYARLTDKASMARLYGSLFKILSADKMTYTVNNGGVKISEWIIICAKR